MDLQDFVSKCLTQIKDGLSGSAGFELDGGVYFDVPLSAKPDQLEIPFGDNAKSSGHPRISFTARRPVKAD